MFFERESDLASLVVKDLKDSGWEVYEEIAPKGGGSKRADIVAGKDGVTRVIECKLTLGFPVLYQGQGWVGYADEVYVAVPWLQVWNGRRRGTSNLAVRTALEVVQIGVIECKSGKFGTESKVEYHIPKAWPAVVPRYKKALDSMLRPEVQEFQAAAGTSGGTF
jgi:hypothetical protein